MSTNTFEIETETITESANDFATVQLHHKHSASVILESFRSAQNLALQTKANGCLAVEEALRCGQLLATKKAELEHGEWLPWVKQYVPEIGVRKAQLWMKLSAAALKCDDNTYLTDAPSVRRAFKILKILPDSTGAKLPNKSGNTYLSLINELTSHKLIEALIQTGEFSSWEESDLGIAISTIEPLSSVRERMLLAQRGKPREKKIKLR